MSSPEQEPRVIYLYQEGNHTFQIVTMLVLLTGRLCQVALGALYESFAFGFFSFLFVCFFKLNLSIKIQQMHIITFLWSAKCVHLRIDGGAWNCEYVLHIGSTWMNEKLNNIWTFFQDSCKDGDGKMDYCHLSPRFLTHMRVL